MYSAGEIFDKDKLPDRFEKGYRYLLYSTPDDGLTWDIGLYMSKLDCMHEMKANEAVGLNYFYFIAEIKQIVNPDELWLGLGFGAQQIAKKL